MTADAAREILDGLVVDFINDNRDYIAKLDGDDTGTLEDLFKESMRLPFPPKA